MSQPYAQRKFDKAKKQAYDMNYVKENYDSVHLTLPKGDRDRFREIAKGQGLSLNEFIRTAIDSYINS